MRRHLERLVVREEWPNGDRVVACRGSVEYAVADVSDERRGPDGEEFEV
jgi:hypothetical protein